MSSQQDGSLFFVGSDRAMVEHAVCKPNAIKTWRVSEVLSGAKSDPGGAEVIADYPRVRFHRLRPAAPLPCHTTALHAVVRDVTAAGLTEKRLAAFRAQRGYSGKKPAPVQVGVLTTLNTAIFRYFPHAGTINAGQILAEWGDAREVFTHPDTIAALAGITPFTKESGKQRSVSFATNSRFASLWAADIDNRARASGKDPPHPTRVLARAWIPIDQQVAA